MSHGGFVPGRSARRDAPAFPRRRSGVTRASVALTVAALVFVVAGSAGAQAPTPGSTTPPVLAVHGSSYTIEQGAFTVGVEVSDPAAVTFAYFLFCQLSSPVCYNPVAMTQNGTNWFSGTTHLMSSYHGMTVGVQAGYNITIQYANNTNLTEPTLPNPFPGLTIAQEVSGQYMFEMTVGPNLYNVTGTVKDATTGSPIAGASVAVAPGNNSTTTDADGVYRLGGLTNGSYSLTISRSGYTSTTQAVTVSGADAVQNVPLSNGTASIGPSKSPAGNGLLSSPVVWAGVAIAVVVVALLGILLLRRRGGTPPPRSPSAPGSDAAPPR